MVSKASYEASLALVITFGLALRPLAAEQPLPSLIDISIQDIQQAVMAMVNVVISPEVESAVFRVDTDHRSAELTRSTLGFSAEFPIRKRVFNGFWGGALSSGIQDDTMRMDDGFGNPVALNIERHVESVQGSAGLALPLNQHFKLRPYLTGSYTRQDSDTDILQNNNNVQLPPAFLSWNADAITASATAEALYDRWHEGGGRLQLEGVYSLSYSHNNSDINQSLEQDQEHSTWHDVLVLRVRWSAPTSLSTQGRPWRWSSYLNHTNFINQPKEALGFSYYFEAGAGISYEINIRPLDWFGIRFIGFEAGVIQGDDVSGYSLGITFK